MTVTWLHDLPGQSGLTIREEKLQTTHGIPLGQLVEVELNDEHSPCWLKGRARLIVVGHIRDCDGTPLYALSAWPIRVSGTSTRENCLMSMHTPYFSQGHAETDLTPVKGEAVEMWHQSIYEYLKSFQLPHE